MNSNYISVRLQMDKTKADNERVKQWYATAQMIEKQCHILSYPTYLFFSPEGVLVHKERGYKAAKSFLKEAPYRELNIGTENSI